MNSIVWSVVSRRRAVKRSGRIRILRESFQQRPAFDAAVSQALLRGAAKRELPECLRIYRTGPTVAFGRKDLRREGYARAVESARSAAFAPVVRLGGGHAAVFHESTLGFAWTVPESDSRVGVHERFGWVADWLVGALCSLGIDARVGEVEGEYCPGAHSVSARGERKLAGVGQRVIQGAAHVGGVIVVGESERLRKVLTPVYSELKLDWRPESAGSLEDEIGALSLDAVEATLWAELARRADLDEGGLDAATLALAEELESSHQPFPEPANFG